MCPPDAFDVVDVKNPFMEGQRGAVDRAKARAQWQSLVRTFESIGVAVRLVDPVPGCEDMVFTANQTFLGLDASGRRLCVPGRMRHPSRRREVPAFVDWCRREGYAIAEIGTPLFEGSGDAIWHPRVRRIWGGWGHRTSRDVYPALGRLFGAGVETLELATEEFYHLDTCLCAVDERTALLHPPAFTAKGLDALRRGFERLVEVDAEEARKPMACNAAAFHGTHVVLQEGAPDTERRLRALGYEVLPVDTSEFLKSGGSVFCMKQYLW
jgi:N-dimethylarginine dimethylaminohydrolase